jgi:hypothetical protein
MAARRSRPRQLGPEAHDLALVGRPARASSVTGLALMPWTVPMATARASMPVRATNASAAAGSVRARAAVSAERSSSPAMPAQLALDPGAGRVGGLHDGAREPHVVLERQRGAVDHDRAVAELQAGLDFLEFARVVEVDAGALVSAAAPSASPARARRPA